MGNTRFKYFALISFISFLISGKAFSQRNLTPYVNPFIGTAAHGHTFPGACYPFGMMQLSPDTRLTGWDGCSGYHYSDSVIYGFTHTHLSGTGCSDYGDILLMPVPSSPLIIHDTQQTIGTFSSKFSHKKESASPGYYSVVLNNGNITAELTVSERAGIHRYTYAKNDSCLIVLDLQHRNEVLGSELTLVSDTEICGYRHSKDWAKNKWLYYDIRFSKPIITINVFKNNNKAASKKDYTGKNIKAIFGFRHNDKLLVKVGISAVSAANAALNLKTEIPGWDFEMVRKNTEKAWNEYLNKITVSSPDKALMTTFYTALYHTAIHPSLYTDVNGQYRGRDNATHKATNSNVYTVFSLWDTYRAEHPLLTLIKPSLDVQFIQTFLYQYEQAGMLPVWELSANETNCMIGYHSVPVIVDAYLKGIKNFNADEALKAMEHSAEARHHGLAAFRQYGYIPSDKDGESVSKTLEYAYDDWCIAQMAKAMGKHDDYIQYMLLAAAYKNLFDASTGFMRARVNGGWYKPFDPTEVNFNYTEANAWQYTFAVPQDVNGLINLYGSKEKMAKKLDSLFMVSSKTTGRDQSDITGMIGQYAQGNEPSHHMAYLFNYCGQPWKTAENVRKIESLYTSGADGLCGNEDCGQMSAWYVMSAMGIYQVCPGDGQFILTSPLFDTVSIHFENGKVFSIISHKLKPNAKYITSASLNGNDYRKSFIKYNEMMNGGELKLTLSDEYNTVWGTGNNVPEDSLEGDNILPEPYAENNNVAFSDSVKVVLKGHSSTDTVHYAIFDSSGGYPPMVYTKPFYMHKTGNVMFWATCKGKGSMENTAYYRKVPKERKIKLLTEPDKEYSSGGGDALIDYQHGTEDFRLGGWLGFWGRDFEAVVDLGSVQNVKKIGAEFLQDEGSWIHMPLYVDISVSNDGEHFIPLSHLMNQLPEKEMEPTIRTFGEEITPQKIRYIKVYAKNIGVLPAWDENAGNKAWVFIDEIMVN